MAPGAGVSSTIATASRVNGEPFDGQEATVTESKSSTVFHLASARQGVPGPNHEHAISVFRHGSLDARLACAPPRPTETSAHTQDEVYVVAQGRGVLLHGEERDPFETGDLLFVAAGTKHRFEDFSEDLVVWVVFYGPQGGEVPREQ